MSGVTWAMGMCVCNSMRAHMSSCVLSLHSGMHLFLCVLRCVYMRAYVCMCERARVQKQNQEYGLSKIARIFGLQKLFAALHEWQRAAVK